MPGVAGWLLAPLLLLVIRPALVFATAGPRFMDRRARLFLGFFGVRGVAALYYASRRRRGRHASTPTSSRSSCGPRSSAS